MSNLFKDFISRLFQSKSKPTVEPRFKIPDIGWKFIDGKKNVKWMFTSPIHRRVVLVDAFLKKNEDKYLAYMCLAYLLGNKNLNFTKYLHALCMTFLGKKALKEVNIPGEPKKEINEFFKNYSRGDSVTKEQINRLQVSIDQIFNSIQADLLVKMFEDVEPYEYLHRAYTKEQSFLNTPRGDQLKNFKLKEFITTKENPKDYLKELNFIYSYLEMVGFPMDAIFCGVNKT